ncbi:hypothetical protein [Aeromonas caviae]|uniref:hypothetical protein n=1 Tax=Aeromonas caviae TaxID=648 RepID=UPI003F746006
MKWIFALLFLIPSFLFAAESAPAKVTNSKTCSGLGISQVMPVEQCRAVLKAAFFEQGYKYAWSSQAGAYSSDSTWNQLGSIGSIYVGYERNGWGGSIIVSWQGSSTPTYSCPPDGKPDFTIGPVDLNGSKVCQKPPKICMMGAILRVASDGKETCVPNCSSAAGMAHQSQFFYQAGLTAGSTAGEIKCYGQCAIQTVGGGGVQLANGAWTGNFTFTGANCPVIRPEPTVDSESNTGGNGNAPSVDESTTSQGTDNALDELSGAASSATGSQVQPSATGPDGTSTLNDVAQTVADAANAQIQATSSQNVATGNLIANTTKDLQNTIIRTGSAGASSVLQAQGNSKLDGIGSAIGEGNGKLDGIKDALDQISDKLDKEEEGDGPFVPGAGSGAFWESVIPESSFTEIKEKQAESIQKMKDLNTEFQSSIKFTDLSASGEPDEWTLNMNGTAMPFGMGAFQMILDMGLAAIVLFICALYAVYIIANRK